MNNRHVSSVIRGILGLGLCCLVGAPLAVAGPGHMPPPPPPHRGHMPPPPPHRGHMPPPPPPARVVTEYYTNPGSTTTYVYETTSTVTPTVLRLTGGELLMQSSLPRQAEIVLTAGQELIFSIEENMTTGYQWVAGGTTQGGAVSVAVAHNAANSNLAGAPGSASFKITGNTSGEAVIVLQYKRSWENTAAATLQVKVTVNPAAVAVTRTVVVPEAPARVIATAPVSGMHLRDGQFYALDMLADECVAHLDKSGRDEIKFYLEEIPGCKWRAGGDKKICDVDVSNNKNRKVPEYFNRTVRCAEIELEANNRGWGFNTLELRRDDGALVKVVNLRIVVR